MYSRVRESQHSSAKPVSGLCPCHTGEKLPPGLETSLSLSEEAQGPQPMGFGPWSSVQTGRWGDARGRKGE